jgi:hypothetical protein
LRIGGITMYSSLDNPSHEDWVKESNKLLDKNPPHTRDFSRELGVFMLNKLLIQNPI